MITFSPALILGVVLIFYLISSIQILAEYERGVIFRLGKLLPQPKGPGVILVFRPIDRIVRLSLRTLVHDVPPAGSTRATSAPAGPFPTWSATTEAATATTTAAAVAISHVGAGTRRRCRARDASAAAGRPRATAARSRRPPSGR